jgi:hypothetical protein
MCNSGAILGTARKLKHLPTLAPLSFGRDIESTMLSDDFIKKMAKNTIKHGFWQR